MAVFVLLALALRLVYLHQGKPFIYLRSILKKRAVELITCIGISSFIFLLIPHFFFDDAGFILRYLDNFSNGYIFKYNTNDPPVYGISGFTHGLICGTLCYLHLTTPEQALYFSNWFGFIATSFFIFLICKTIIKQYWMAILIWIIMISCSKMYLSVASSGLETPIHLSFVFGAISFFIAKKDKPFLLFTALMIISKLDTVPIAIILIFLHILIHTPKPFHTTTLFPIIKNICIWFVVPLAIGIGTITFIFGSPLPQSAYTKLFLHTHAKDKWFPFLEYFTSSPLNIFILVSSILAWILHLIESIYKKERNLLINGVFGSLFIGTLMLYYFYNPGERMMWYYAMPELLLIFQLVYSIWYFFHHYATKKIKTIIPLTAIFLLSSLLWSSVYGGLMWLENSVKPYEIERERIGSVIGDMSTTNQMLFSGHGLLSRHFKGNVMDISGLNSKKATDYKLDHELIIQTFKPDYIINHAAWVFVERYNKFNYQLIDVYRDISTVGSNSWILLRKTIDPKKKHEIGLFDPSLFSGSISRNKDIYILSSNKQILTLIDGYKADEKYVHVGLERKETDWLISCDLYKDGEKIRALDYIIPSTKTQIDSPSKKMYDIRVNISNTDSIQFRSGSSNSDFNMFEPIYELVYYTQNNKPAR